MKINENTMKKAQEEALEILQNSEDKAEAVFGNFRMDLLLPVLSYQYGLWMNYLYVFMNDCPWVNNT